MSSPYLTRSESAEYLRCSVETIDRLISKGRLRFTHLQDGGSIRRIRILRADVETILPQPTSKDQDEQLSNVIAMTKQQAGRSK